MYKDILKVYSAVLCYFSKFYEKYVIISLKKKKCSNFIKHHLLLGMSKMNTVDVLKF